MTNLQFYYFSNTEIVLFLFQLMYKQRTDMNNVLQKIYVESSRQDQTQLDSASESRKIISVNFYFSVYRVVTYTGNYF